MRWGQSQKADTCGSCPAGSLSQLSFAEEASADEDEQALSRGKHKKKGNKLEKTELEKETGEPRSSADKAGRRAAWVRVEPRRPLLWLKRKDADCVIFGAPTGSLNEKPVLLLGRLRGQRV